MEKKTTKNWTTEEMNVFCSILVDTVNNFIFTLEQRALKKSYYKRGISETVAGGVVWKKVFLKISQNSQDDTCARVSFSKVAGVKVWNFFKISE